MLKHVISASAAMMAVPAIAQQAAPVAQTAPVTSAAAPGTAQVAPTTAVADDATGSAAQAAPVQTAPGDSATQGTNQPDQVAAILDSEFPTYDKDKSGALSKAEFATWMDTLKAKADPAAKPNKAWNDAAFKKADSDKSASVSKTELAVFLSSGTTSG